jgi:octopine/nopaline transport system permease protein
VTVDLVFMADVMNKLLQGVPLLLNRSFFSIAVGAVLAFFLALMRMSESSAVRWASRAYVFIFRGTPLLLLLFLIYYGLGQFQIIRQSLLWPFLRDAYWCALLALVLNTAASGSELIRGGLMAVPHGAVESARACGMSRLLLFRRIILPTALRHALPAYSSEIILMIKATSQASIVTLLEVTGIANKLISQTYRATEIFICAALIYLVIIFIVTRLLLILEYWLSPHLRETSPELKSLPLPA